MNYCTQMTLFSWTKPWKTKERFWNWKEAVENKGVKVNIRKTKVMVGKSEGELFNSKIDPRGVCGRRVMANSVLCMKRGN